MHLSAGTNFDDRLPEAVTGSQVKVFYGKMSSDIVGGGRPAFALPPVDKKRVAQHVKVMHQQGVKFNYLLNAACCDNLETTPAVNRQIRSLMEWLGETGVDYVTVTIPLLIDMAKEVIPGVKICLSTFANVHTLSQVKYYEDAGVWEITLPESKNRDFKFLEGVRRSTSCHLQLIATNDCLLNCPLRFFHPNFQSHASQSHHPSEGFALDYCMLRCTQYKLRHPEELLKSPWIRPEDLHFYEDMGYHRFKLTERLKTTDAIARVIHSYSNREYQGNLLRLLNTRLQEEDFIIPNLSMIMNGKHVPAGQMASAIRLIFALKASISNHQMDGFLEGFRDKDCEVTGCDRCGYCKRWADRVVEMQCDVAAGLEEFDRFFARMASGELFKEGTNQENQENQESQESQEEKPMEWPAETVALLEKMIELKPEVFRSMARAAIKKDAGELARGAGLERVLPVHVAKANIRCTPEDFRHFARSDVKSMGFDLEELMGEGG